jgi:hypothetical protein
MMKECFKQEFVDARKFRECAECPIFEECTQAVYLKNARGACLVGEVLGYGLGLFGIALAGLLWPTLPNGAPWLLLASFVYLIAVYFAGKGYRTRNQEQAEHAVHAAEAKPEGGAPAPVHGHAAH